MAFGPNNFQPISAFPQRATYPAYIVEPISVNVAGGGSATLGGNANGDWMVPSYSLLSWVLDCRSLIPPDVPFTVFVMISPDDGTTFYNYETVALYPGSPNFLINMFLPGWLARFQAYNTDPAVAKQIVGFIRMQAVT